MQANKRVLELLERFSENPNEIEDVTRDGLEFYFHYSGHAFSVMKHTNPERFGDYSFYAYPKWTRSLDSLAALSSEDPEAINMAVFHSIETEGLSQTLSELYALLAAKDLNLDEVLDDILGPDF